MAYTPISSAGRTLALLVRHGHTQANEGRTTLRGWDDMPLAREGELDAQMAGNNLRKYDPKIIYSSDLSRDMQTAQIVAGILDNLPTEVAFELRTADVGELTGQFDDEVVDQMRRWYMSTWIDAPSGESYDSFVSRFYPWVDRKLQMARDVPQYCPIVMCSHGRNFAALDSRYNFKVPIDGKMAMHGGIAEIKEMPDGRISFEFIGPTEELLADR